MPRHTPGYAVAVLMALTMPILSTAEAQLPPSQYDRLQRTLEERFAPPKQQRPRAPATGGSSGSTSDFIYVEPDKSKQTTPAPGQKRSDVSWGQSI